MTQDLDEVTDCRGIRNKCVVESVPLRIRTVVFSEMPKSRERMKKMEDLAVAPAPALVRRQIEDRLREAILSGRFAPNDRLIERELCERMQVSRTSVREALRQLESEGLVTLVPFKGPVVTGLSHDQARRIYQVRELLEGFAGGAFAELADADQRARLEDVFRELSGAVAAARYSNLLEIKEQFYRVLIAGCGNPLVGDMLQLMNNRVRRLRATSLSDPNRPRQTLRELQRVMDAIAARDAVAARKACEGHVQAAAEVALRLLQEPGSPAEGTDEAM